MSSEKPQKPRCYRQDSKTSVLLGQCWHLTRPATYRPGWQDQLQIDPSRRWRKDYLQSRWSSPRPHSPSFTRATSRGTYDGCIPASGARYFQWVNFGHCSWQWVRKLEMPINCRVQSNHLLDQLATCSNRTSGIIPGQHALLWWYGNQWAKDSIIDDSQRWSNQISQIYMARFALHDILAQNWPSPSRSDFLLLCNLVNHGFSPKNVFSKLCEHFAFPIYDMFVLYA